MLLAVGKQSLPVGWMGAKLCWVALCMDTLCGNPAQSHLLMY